MSNYDFPHRLFLTRGNYEARPARPAPMENSEPSEKVQEALAQILPKIRAFKNEIHIEEIAADEED